MPPPPGNDDARRRPGSRDLTPLAALLPFLRPHRGKIVLAAIALAVAAGATLVLPGAVRKVIDQGFSAAASPDHIGGYFLGLMAVTVVMGVAAAMRYYLVTWIGERVVSDVRHKVFSHILSLSPVFFETTRTGEVLSRLTADTTLVQTVVGSSASLTLRSLVMAIGSVVLMAITSPKLTALAFAGLPLALVPIITLGRRVRGLSRSSQDRIADTAAMASETLNSIQTVQAFTHEDEDRRLFGVAVEDSFRAAVRRTRMRACMTAIVIMLVGGCVVGVLWIGAIDVLSMRMTAGQLGQFVLYAMLLA
ncbi:MAG TPA: ABC transporter transmembrane domain-containing protein, partial [Steroidobacteraceae bacterium]|nr:ABC transporter transmembrane domain-containing protein [Steroidobacteraceae bacterium]